MDLNDTPSTLPADSAVVFLGFEDGEPVYQVFTGRALEGKECAYCETIFEQCPGVQTYMQTYWDPAEYACPEDFPITHDREHPGCPATTLDHWCMSAEDQRELDAADAADAWYDAYKEGAL